MAKNIKVLVNTGNEETNKTFDVASGSGKSGKPTTIKAVKGARYHLEDPAAKNVGPENIRSKRVGKNLHVMLDGSSEADLIIEGYYDDAMLTENNRGLYGRAEDGKLYEYIPEDPTASGLPINLAEGGKPVSQVLGGGQVGEDFALSGVLLAAAGGGFSALTAGAAAVGAAAVAGGGGGGGGAAAVTDPAATALASIKAAAENNTATSGNLAASVFTAAGITGVDANNLAAIQSALDSAALNGAAADTKAEVQAIVDAYKAIKDNADTAATTNATQAQYAAVGVTGIDNAAKTNLLGDVVDTKAFADVDTVPELQTLATAAAAVITGAAAGTQPTKAQLEALGITGVTDANLSAIQAAIAATPDDGTGVDTLTELQAVANTGATNAANAAAALSAIAAAAQANNATDANVATSVFATAGVTGVDSTNVAAIQSALNSAAVIGTSADTLAEVQAIVDAYNAVKANADGTANNNATNPTQAQYAAIGVTGVDSNVKASLLGDVVDSKPFTAVDTVPELQALADAAAAVMTGAAGGTAPTKAQLEALGITGVTDANLAEVQATIARTADDGIGVDTLAELQAVVTIGADAAAAAAAAAVAAALAAISAAAQANDASNTNVAAGVFATAGVTGVDSTNVAAIQSALNSAAVNGSATDTLVEIQNIVNAYNAIRENADGTAANYANNPTQAQYALIGVTGVDSAAKESLLGDVVDSKPFTAVDSVPEVQALADAAAAVIAGATGGTAPTQAQLNALGITGVTPANLAAVQAAIAANGSGAAGVDTLTELQTVVTNAAAAAAALDAIKTAAENNSAGTTPTVADFAAAGITGVDSTNFAAINSALNSAAVNGAAADTKPEVQAIVDAYNAIKANADGTANNNATNPTAAQYTAIGVTGVNSAEKESLLGDVVDAKPFTAVDTVAEVQALADAAAAVMTGATGGTAPTQSQLEALGITGVTPANLAAVQAAIAANGSGAAGVDTLTELQTVVTNAAAAAALDAIKTAAENNSAGTTPSLADFATAGITGVDANNFAAINSALNSAAVNGAAADTKPEVQAIVDAYNAIKANADTASTANATQAQYAAVGVTGIDNAAKTNLLGDVVDAKAFADVDTVPELQALANAAAAVITGATGGTAPTQTQLEALGITGVTSANLAAVVAAIAATGNGGTGVDTLGELQTVVTNAANAAAAAAALSAIAAAAQANDATDTNVATTVFATAGVTGVDANNVAAIQSALNSAAVLGTSADTLGAVQAIVDAYNAIKANADNATAANATDAQYAAIGVTGVDSAVKTSLLGDAIDGKAFADVDTVAEVQALADAAAAVMSGAAGSTAPTQAQLAALGITGVTPANLAAVQAAIAATTDNGTGVDTLSELQTVVTNAVNAAAATTAALDTIKAAAEANSATSGNLAASVFATAGVTGVDGTNLSAIQSALDSAAVNGIAADTTAEVQAIVDAYKVIKDNADTAGTTNATAAQYTAVGVTGIDNAAKASLLGDVVDTKAFADVDTVLELQTLATAAAAVITGAAAGTAPTKAQLEALGITGVTDANLSAIQAAIAATADDGTGVDTLSELQAVANTGATNAANAAAITAALSTIAAAAQANNATNTNVPASVFATAGVTGVDANNIAAIQSALNDADVQSGQADTTAKVQAVVDAYNAIKANADTAGTNNATQAQYAAIGINGIDSAAKTSLLGDVVDTKAFADVDTVAKVQALADLAALVINSAGTGTAPTKAQLESLGITGVTDANLSAIQAAIAATADDGTGVDTLAELQAVANTGATNAANAAAAAAALSTIAAAAQANDATNTNVAASVFATAGVTGVDSTNVAAIQSALNSAAVVGTSVDTLGEVQAVVDAYKAILAEANDTANTAGNGTPDANPASNPTAAQYAAIGVNLGSAPTDAATDPETLALLNAIVGGKQAADVGTVADVQALATIANAIQLKAAGGTPNPALTIADLQKIGLDTTGVSTDNLPTLLAAIALKSDTGSETDTLEKLQALITSLDKVAPVAVNDTSSATENTVTQTGNVSTNDTSKDTTETYTLVSNAAGTHGTLTLGTDGAYTYTYGAGIHAITANVTDTFTYRVTDAAGNTSTATLAVTVTPVNDAATFSGDISKATSETDVAQTITGQLNVADVDSATTVVAQTNVAGSAGLGKFTITTAGAWTYVMDNAQNQLKPTDVITDSLTVSTADGTTQTISVVITGTNDAPIIANALADTTATATVAITNYVVPANAFSDVDSTSLTYTATLADGSALSTVGLSFDAATRTVSGTPSAGTAGSTLSVKVTASDGSLSDFDTFDITVASPDSIAPTLLSSSPADNGTVAYANVANDLTLTFSEAVQKGTGLIELYNVSNTLVESFDVASSTLVTGWNGSTLTINPTANLAAGTGYYLKVATTAIKDLANNAYAGITDATTLNFTVSAGTGSVIDLGTSGQLIAPVQVEGKWYYFWDRSGDGTSANTGSLNGGRDATTHDTLDGIFQYDINGNLNPNPGTNTDDVYRYATLNGVMVALPTANGGMSFPQGYAIQNGTAAIGYGTTNNSSYDELLAIWDTTNGTGTTAAGDSGTPTGWQDGGYLSATLSPTGHAAVRTGSASIGGTVQDLAETAQYYVALEVVKANTAPVLDAAQTPTLTSLSPSAAAPVNGNTTAGDLVSSLVVGISDTDAGALKGIAITGVHTGGTLYYSLDGGTTWLTPATTLSDTNALLLAADTNTRVFYKANGTSGTIADAITFRGWDETQHITEGVFTSTVANGGKSEFSTATDTVGVFASLPMGTTLSLGTVSGLNLNLINKVTGSDGKVYYFVDTSGDGTSSYLDAVSHDQLDTLFNAGSDTTGLSAATVGVDTERSVIVNGYTLVLPNLAELTSTTITWPASPTWTNIYRYWTSTLTTAGYHNTVGHNRSGTYSDIDTVAGGQVFVVQVLVPVAPVVLDLNRDGTFSYTQVAMDVNGSNHLSLTQWAGAQDGVLVWDKLGDGVVHDNSQYAFGQYATSTRVDAAGHNRVASDLEGLSDAFDTNHDGVFNAADAKFAEFKVWQDVNQNGVSDAGEVRSLADWGITNINLVSDGVQRTPVAGVTEVGQSTAAMADGSSMQVADALFAYNALDYTLTGAASGDTLNLLGSNMTLDLSSVAAVHSNVTAIDLTGSAVNGTTGANTLKLNLADVLTLPLASSAVNGVHKLTLTGDANDTVELDLSQWANTGNTVTEGDHTYAVYNASSAAAAQLLIDQHMVLANHG
ncbi:hypothetical protein C5F52_03465 [Limnohabitans sp. TS-CS-82]|uniref:beta strand repeat-containing protein n=1 Tax=Limnohabitans sp. TS-CS-82 TaxID=2094193 RepID=UPI000CF2341D|nr:VCBS domain-containing protein [Limnohabitans sp. TS-CS-82]PQA85063.1 hypothetical protein C5F52_03465 [Limnohabitans sp. TS-CS-82]